MTDFAVGDALRVSIDRPAHGGEGIAHDPDGRILFVRGGLPGDVVSARLTKVKKRWASAEIDDVLEAGPFRQDVDCPAAEAGPAAATSPT